MKNLLTFILVLSACTVWAQESVDANDPLHNKAKVVPLVVTLREPPTPVYLSKTDGVYKEITKEDFDALMKPSSRVKSVSVLRPDDLLNVFGERGKHGLIVVEMKANPFSTPSLPTNEHPKN